jgi:AcrR family transcriptional regulator
MSAHLFEDHEESACSGAPARCVNDAAAQRRKAFVDAAREAFFAHGYAGTTMSSIASTVGGSKTTLWSYFPAKEDLFAAVVDDLAEQYCEALTVDMPPDAPLEPTLRRFAAALMRTLLSEPMMQLQRLVIGEATRFPHLAATFYNSAPARGRARLAAYFAAVMARGDMRPGDPAQAASQLKALLSSGVYFYEQHKLPGDRSPAAVERDVDAALETFLRGWAPDPAG